MQAINFIKEFKLILGTQEIIADPDEFQFLEMRDEGLRTFSNIRMVIHDKRLDTQGRPLKVLGEYSDKYQALINIEARHYVRKVGKTADPSIRFKGPFLLAVYDNQGNEVKDQEIFDRISCYLEIRQSYEVKLSEEFKRQTGRTMRFMNTLNPGEIVIAHDEAHAKMYQGFLDELSLPNQISIMDLNRLQSSPQDIRSYYRVPHDYYEHHQIDVMDILN